VNCASPGKGVPSRERIDIRRDIGISDLRLLADYCTRNTEKSTNIGPSYSSSPGTGALGSGRRDERSRDNHI
jgi:hypothetical protein